MPSLSLGQRAVAELLKHAAGPASVKSPVPPPPNRTPLPDTRPLPSWDNIWRHMPPAAIMTERRLGGIGSWRDAAETRGLLEYNYPKSPGRTPIPTPRQMSAMGIQKRLFDIYQPRFKQPPQTPLPVELMRR